MKLSELIEHVGNDHVQIQDLAQSLVSAKAKTNDGEITFATDHSKVVQLSTGQKPDHVGIVVWLPRNRLPEHLR